MACALSEAMSRSRYGLLATSVAGKVPSTPLDTAVVPEPIRFQVDVPDTLYSSVHSRRSLSCTLPITCTSVVSNAPLVGVSIWIVGGGFEPGGPELPVPLGPIETVRLTIDPGNRLDVFAGSCAMTYPAGTFASVMRETLPTTSDAAAIFASA